MSLPRILRARVWGGAALAVALLGAGAAAEQPAAQPLRTIYVSPRGNDGNDGLSAATALRTIGKAAALVKPGDLVLVAGGTYREQVVLKTAGTEQHPITFQAAEGETALVTWEERPAGWRAFPDARRCFSTSYAQWPRFVWEDSTLTDYARVCTVQDLGAMPGTFLYDEENHRLTIHPMSGISAEAADIVVVPGPKGVVDDKPASTKGFRIMGDYNTVRGFTLAYQPVGISIEARHCRASGNTVYACLIGIWSFQGHDSVIEHNVCFRNMNNGIDVRSSTGIEVLDNVCRHNDSQGPTLYTDGDLPLVMNMSAYRSNENCAFRGNLVIARHATEAWRYKYVKGNATERNVVVGGNMELGTWGEIMNNTVLGGEISVGDTRVTPETAAKNNVAFKGNLVLTPEMAADTAVRKAMESGFADPLRDDYRLHAHSPNLGQGAFPEPANVFYVSTTGDDAADGRSPATAWRHIAKAVAAAQPPNATIYVMPGVYAESVNISPTGVKRTTLTIKNYGGGAVVLDGEGRLDYGVHIHQASLLLLDGLIFRGFKETGVLILDTERVEIADCVFDGDSFGVLSAEVGALLLTNNTFLHCKSAISVDASTRHVVLRNNLFSDTPEKGEAITFNNNRPAIIESERNGFRGARAKELLAAWSARVKEAHASIVVETGLDENYRPDAPGPVAYSGFGHRPIGAMEFADVRPIPIEAFVVRQLTPDRAIIAWNTPEDYPDAMLTWISSGTVAGSTAVTQDRAIKKTLGAAILNGLKPDTKYEAALAVKDLNGGQRRGAATLAFTTPKTARAPATLYVSPEGSDANAGTDPKLPLRTLMAASYSALPGDEVLVSPGVYAEHLIIFAGGLSEERPLVFRSVKPGAAIIDCGNIRSSAIWVLPLSGSETEQEDQAARDWVRNNRLAVSHLVIDGFRIRNVKHSKGGNHCVIFNDVTDGRFVNNIYEAAPDTDIVLPLQLNNCRHVLIRNNIFVHGIGFIEDWWGRSNDIVIDHNIFQGMGGGKGGNYVVFLENTAPDLKVRVTNNIFGSPLQFNKAQPIIRLGRPSPGIVVDYNLYWLDQESAKPYKYAALIFGYKQDPEKRKEAATIEEARALYGIEQHGKFADPMFADPYRGDFRLKPGSPAIGMGEGGSTVGASIEEGAGGGGGK